MDPQEQREREPLLQQGRSRSNAPTPLPGAIPLANPNPIGNPSASNPSTASKAQKKQPNRTTKTNKKLVVFPSTEQYQADYVTDVASEYADDDVPEQRQKVPLDVAKEREAERTRKLSKSQLSRVTAYCTANAYKMDDLLAFLKSLEVTNETRPRQIDECIYTTYKPPFSIFQFPQPPSARASTTATAPSASPPKRARTPRLKQVSPSNLDLESGTAGDVSADEDDELRPSNNNTTHNKNAKKKVSNIRRRAPTDISDVLEVGNEDAQIIQQPSSPTPSSSSHRRTSSLTRSSNNNAQQRSSVPAPVERTLGELFFFEYGVVVIWGLSLAQEQLVLSLLKPFELEKLHLDQVETEEFHWQYRAFSQARIYNDVITLRTPHTASTSSVLEPIGEGSHVAVHQDGPTADAPPKSPTMSTAATTDALQAGTKQPQSHQQHQDQMIKLTISHAIAQSVKLTLFENLIDDTIDSTKHIPYIMARTGKVPLSRTKIIKKIGHLFIMRMNVNLISPILDTPELFWSEPTLEPIYSAARTYLEISQRVELLNQRVTVLSDLLEMLKEHLNSAHGETLEWIIIILIAIEILIGLVTIFFDFWGLVGPKH